MNTIDEINRKISREMTKQVADRVEAILRATPGLDISAAEAINRLHARIRELESELEHARINAMNKLGEVRPKTLGDEEPYVAWDDGCLILWRDGGGRILCAYRDGSRPGGEPWPEGFRHAKECVIHHHWTRLGPLEGIKIGGVFYGEGE